PQGPWRGIHSSTPLIMPAEMRNRTLISAGMRATLFATPFLLLLVVTPPGRFVLVLGQFVPRTCLFVTFLTNIVPGQPMGGSILPTAACRWRIRSRGVVDVFSIPSRRLPGRDCHDSHSSASSGVYADRAIGGDRHHRHTDRPAPARRAE